LAGFAPVFGIYGISLLVVLLAAMLACTLAQQQSVIWKRNVIASTMVILVTGLFLKAYPWSQAVGQPTSVALIQGNVSQLLKWSPEHAQNTIDLYTRMVNESDAELTIVPETALPVTASRLSEEIKTFFTEKGKANNGNVIVGMVSDTENGEYLNSVVSYGKDASQTYAKNHLVPFGEFIPLKAVFGWIYRDWLNMPLSDLSRGGASQAPMQLGNQKVAMNICYEDVFGEEVMTQLPEATLMVNVSNDAWATAMIDRDGQVLAYAPQHQQTTLKGYAQGYTGTTPYMLWGNWAFLVISAAALVFVIRRKTK